MTIPPLEKILVPKDQMMETGLEERSNLPRFDDTVAISAKRNQLQPYSGSSLAIPSESCQELRLWIPICYGSREIEEKSRMRYWAFGLGLLQFLLDLLQILLDRFTCSTSEEYGDVTDIYNCDTFNENSLPTNDPTYISSLGAAVYKAMSNGDKDALWLVQGWLFYRVKFLEATPNEGVGMCMEGIEQNPVVYELMSEMAFRKEKVKVLVVNVLEAGNDLAGSLTYRYDLVDLTRQVLSKLANKVYLDAVEAFRRKDVKALNFHGQKFIQLIKDIDVLVASDDNFLLGTWLESAKMLAKNPSETRQYEWNARTQVTMWFDTTAVNQSQLHDYANKFLEWTVGRILSASSFKLF
ncbi:Polyamine oxidase 1 isoform 1 [Hibiscus syriacus]|uniref:Polyamine oxidase 1 isoform 1 n=1 Tax=Hibiscus syriacus TaxID=106335 RepID=A0A6A3CHV6_HIBSY|nr:Polyamine oxidase 1 isoform 1 [Hibiscus syriacus]